MKAKALAENSRAFPPGERGQTGDGPALANEPGVHGTALSGFPADPEATVLRFLRSFRVLLRSARLYQKNHPRVLESLDAADRSLRAALAAQSPVAIGVEGGQLVVPALRARSFPDPRGEFHSLAGELARCGVTSLIFFPETNQGELNNLSQILNDSLLRASAESQGDAEGDRESRPEGLELSSQGQAGDAAPSRPRVPDNPLRGRGMARPDWTAQLAQQRIHGIRVNATLDRKVDSALASLVAALLAYGGVGATETGDLPTLQGSPETAEELTSLLLLLAEIHRTLEHGQQLSPQEAARSLHAVLADANHRVVRLLVAATTLHPPHEEEIPESYSARLADGFVLEFVAQAFRSSQVTAPELRGLFARLCAGTGLSRERPRETRRSEHPMAPGVSSGLIGTPSLFARWADEAHAETLHERFWAEIPAREKSAVLRSRDAWCIPVTVLRRYLEQLIQAGPDAPVGASSREARLVLLNYASCLETDEKPVRRAVAAGLVELYPLLVPLWPHQLPEELSRGVLRAVEREPSPGTAGLLAAATENLARLALDQGDYAGFERILEALEGAPQDAEHAHLAALAKRLIADERWIGLVDAALFHWPRTPHGLDASRALDPVLPRLLRRDPARLLDRLSLLLTGPQGSDAVPAMARVLRAVGEPALGALEARLVDGRRQRAVAAIKLLAVVQPERLAAALPRVLPLWDWRLQDLAVSELARPAYLSHLPGAAHAFLLTLAQAHPMVVPMMLDQIGLAEETAAVPVLLEIAEGKHPRLQDLFIRIKAIEALGRMRAPEAVEPLQAIVERRHGLVHAEPAGLRAAAEEALALIENHPSSARVRATYEAMEKASLSFTRPRRYPRVPLSSPLSAQIEGPLTFARGSSVVTARVHTISLGGAFLEANRRLNVGDSIRVAIRTGLRHIHGTAVVRNVASNGGGIEFVHMAEEDREKLRRLVRKLQRS